MGIEDHLVLAPHDLAQRGRTGELGEQHEAVEEDAERLRERGVARARASTALQNASSSGSGAGCASVLTSRGSG